MTTTTVRADRHDWLVILGPCFLALFIRIAFIVQIRDVALFQGFELDSRYYDAWALSISRGNIIGNDAFYGLPLYPYILGLLYSLFGHSIEIARFSQAVFDAVSCYLLFLVGKYYFSKPVGVAAALVFAFYGMAIFFNAFLVSTSLAMLLVLLILLTLHSILVKATYPRWAFLGLLIGVTALTNSSVLLFSLFIAAWAFISGNPAAKKRLIPSLGVMTVALLFPLSLSTVHNYAAARDFVPLTSHAGITFYAGNNPLSQGTYRIPGHFGDDVEHTRVVTKKIAEEKTGRRLKPSEVSGYWFNEGIRFIRENPARYLRLALRKVYFFWWTREIPESFPLSAAREHASVLRFAPFGFAIISPLSLLGMALSFRREDRTLPILYLYILSIQVSSVLYFINTRYRLAIEPVLILFAVNGIVRLYELIKQNRYFLVVVLITATSGVFFILNINIATYDKASVYTKLGISYANKGKMDEAQAAFERAAEINPAAPVIQFNLGTFYLNRQEHQKSIHHLTNAIRSSPDYIDAHNNIGTAYLKLGNVEMAVRHFKRSLEINPNQQNIREAVEGLQKR